LEKTLRRINLKKVRAARSDTIRDINRQIVLNYVREREPISRATISRETALQRSTVSAIVDALISDGLIDEIGAGESTGGRRPKLLSLRREGALAIGIDITPSKSRIAVSNLAGLILEQKECPTDKGYEHTVYNICVNVRQLLQKYQGKVEGIGISVPGIVDTTMSNIIHVPYFDWRDLNIGKDVSDGTGLDVTVDNDANAAALAELWFGRPEVSDVRDFIMILASDGIGTGIVFDGQIYRGEYGAAGEFGHMVIGSDAPVACSCGSHRCWEAFSSRYSSVARYTRLKGSNNEKEIDFSTLVHRAFDGDKAALAALKQTAEYLGIGISNLIVGFSPEAIVVGGEFTKAWSLIFDTLQETVERRIRRGLPSARLIASTLGEQPTLLGSLSLVLARKFASSRSS
jgi:predicted NBD/HSP70 family sugar kinase